MTCFVSSRTQNRNQLSGRLHCRIVSYRIVWEMAALKPNSITLASSQLVRSWFEAEIWPIIQLASSELAQASSFAAKFHYAIAGSELAPNQLV